MKRLFLIPIAFILNGLATAATTEPPPAKKENPAVEFEKGQVRELKVTLYDEKSKPVADVAVDLYSEESVGEHWPKKDLNADAAKPEKEKEKEKPKGKGKDKGEEKGKEKEKSADSDRWWHFTTGKDGTFTVRFPVKATPWGEAAPAEGAYYLVAELPDGRRSVSARIFHGLTPDQAADYELNEWDAEDGGDRVFTDENHTVDMQLTLGRSVSGTIVDPDGKPLAGKSIFAEHDLHVDSPEGEGGIVFSVKATSDDKGHFQLDHIYPTACAFSVEGGFWTRTQIKYKTKAGSSARWINEPLDKFPDLPDEDSVELTVVMSPKAPTFKFFGTVTDEAGKPQSGLVIVAGVSSSATGEDPDDAHEVETTTTDADGHWVLEATEQYVRFFDIRKDEKSQDSLGGEGYENDAFDLAAPGEYNLKLRSAKPPAASTPKKPKKK